MGKILKRCFLNDVADYTSLAVKSINDDNFSRCFTPNRPEKNRPPLKYGFSIILRYLFIFPIRLFIFLFFLPIISIYLFFSIVFKSKFHISRSFLFYAKLCCFVFGAKIRNHGIKPNLEEPHIFVSNHTSILDYLVLSSHEFGHACVVENHGGLFGFIFEFFLSKNGSLAFKRSEKNDRVRLMKKLKDHLNSNKTPMLLFPEGTCVNNDNTVMFQKGVFELGVKICPVTIKYQKKNFDPYWFRRKTTFKSHIFYFLTRLSFEVDVYYHQPVVKKEGENPSEFADRTKAIINEPVKFKNLMWNGYLKNHTSIKDSRIMKQSCNYTYCLAYSDKKYKNYETNKEYKFFGKYSYDEFMAEVSQNCIKIFNGKLPIKDNKFTCSCKK